MKKLLVLAFLGLLVISGALVATGEWFDLFNKAISQYDAPEDYGSVKVAETFGEQRPDGFWFQIIEGKPYVLTDYGNSSTLYSDEGETKKGDFEGMFEYRGRPAYVKKGALDKIVDFEGQELSESYAEINSEIDDYPKTIGGQICFKSVIEDIEQPICGGEKPFISSYEDVSIKDISGTPAFIALNDTRKPEQVEKAVYYEGEEVMKYNPWNDSDLQVHVIDFGGQLGFVYQSEGEIRIEGKNRNLLRNFSIEGNLTGVSEFLTHNQDLYYNVRNFGEDIYNWNSSLYKNGERVITSTSEVRPVLYKERFYYSVAGENGGVFKDSQQISSANGSRWNVQGNLYISNGELVYPWYSEDEDVGGVKHGSKEFELNPLLFPFRGKKFDRMAYIGHKKNNWYLLFETD